MSIDEFWKIIERVHAGSARDMRAKCQLLAHELRQLPAREIQSFDHHFDDCVWLAYSEDIWGAAYIIHGGCGDDSFWNFRSTLISLGRHAFESALDDPDSLADIDIDPEWATFEGYQYVAHKVYEEITGDEMPEYSSPFEGELRGTPFQEWAMSPRYPRLVAKYGYNDSAQLNAKILYEKAQQRELSSERLAHLMLDSGIIPSSGWIPPVRVVRRVLRTGRSPETADRQLAWEPFELDEGDYWAAMRKIGELAKLKPWMRADKLKGDVHGPPGDDFGEWIQSLRARGLM